MNYLVASEAPPPPYIQVNTYESKTKVQFEVLGAQSKLEVGW